MAMEILCFDNMDAPFLNVIESNFVNQSENRFNFIITTKTMKSIVQVYGLITQACDLQY